MNKLNFLGVENPDITSENSKIAIIPVAFEKTSSWIWGSDKGPHAIMEASLNVELFDIETRSEPYRLGIFTDDTITGSDAPEMIKKTSRRVGELLDGGKFVASLGGEHTVSIGPIMAHSQRFKNLSILHLDAHSDRRDSYEDDSFSHACVMARSAEYVNNIVSVGIRSMDSSELPGIDESNIFYAMDIFYDENWIDKVISRLTENVYLTLDLDVFDPSIMPSTGTPEPGGLTWYQVLNLIKRVAAEKNLTGFDVVELCPGHFKAPDFMAAKLVHKIIAYKFA